MIGTHREAEHTVRDFHDVPPIIAVLFMLLWNALVTLPGTLLLLLHWKRSRRIELRLPKPFIQSALITVA